jgi:outer membrane protein, heavy metal efflux system
MARLFLAACAAYCGVAGCAPSQSEVLRSVQSEVATRTGYDIEWRAAPAHDPAIRAAVSELLEDELTVDGAVEVALLANERAMAALEELGIARGELIAATRIPNPEIEAKLRFPLSDGERSLRFDAIQDVISLIDLGRRRGVASAELSAARLEAAGDIVELVANVRLAYYRAVAAERALVMRRTLSDAAEASHSFAEALFEAGNITELELLVERDRFEEARIEVEVAHEHRLARREELSAALGLWGEPTAYRLPAALEEIPLEDPRRPPLERVAVERSLELESSKYALRAAGGEVGLARLSRWIPGLGVGVSAEREGDGGGWAVGPIVAISVPLWDWNTGALRRAEARLSAETRRYTQLAVELRSEARAAEARLRAARVRAERYRDHLLPLRARILEETQLAHNAMTASTFDLLRARRRQLEAELSYLEAKLEYWLAHAAVEQIKAGHRATERPRRLEDASRAGHPAAQAPPARQRERN